MFINIGFDFVHVNQKVEYWAVKRSRKSNRVPQKSFQESIFSYCDQAGRNCVVMGPMKIQELKLGIMTKPMVPVEPCIKHPRPPEMHDDIDQAHHWKKDY